MEKRKPRSGSNFSTARISPQVALLDQVQKAHATVQVAARYLHHQTQIAFDHTLARRLVALLGQVGIVLFFIRREQRNKADFVEVKLSGVEAHVVAAGLAARGRARRHGGAIRSRLRA